ncbi:hypothetical protein GmHk_08G023376 [Glycine max]|nr:hypothetical protein GmHk_08G023376 [Glycine max]
MPRWTWLRWDSRSRTSDYEYPLLGGQEGGPTKQRTLTLNSTAKGETSMLLCQGRHGGLTCVLKCHVASHVYFVDPRQYNNSLIDMYNLNFDDPIIHANHVAACGAISKDRKGTFVQAFPRRLGHCSIVEVALWAIFYGMRMLEEQGIHNLSIKSDSKDVVRIIQNYLGNGSHFQELASEIWSLKNAF